MEAEERIPGSIIGCAGEYFVAYRLCAMGYVVAVTRGGSPSIDLMVATSDGRKVVNIQVKTMGHAYFPSKKHPEETSWNWRVQKKAKNATSGESLFYAFVNLDGSEKGASTQGTPNPHCLHCPGCRCRRWNARLSGKRTIREAR